MSFSRYLFVLLVWTSMFAGPVGAESLWIDHGWRGTQDSFSGPSLWILAAGFGATLIVAPQDKYIHEDAQRSGSWQTGKSIGDVMGTGIPGALIAASSLASGAIMKSEKSWNFGVSHAEALLSTAVVTLAVKSVMERDRSAVFSQGEVRAIDSSFPSAHTSTAFATAGSVVGNFGWTAGAPFLALGAITGYSRVREGAHYASDVIFGASIGLAFGLGFAKHHQPSAKISSTLIPVITDRENMAMVYRATF